MSRKSHKELTAYLAENQYLDYFNNSSKIWNEGNLKVWLLFAEIIVIVSAVGTALVFIYCRKRHQLRRDVNETIVGRYRQKYRWKSMKFILKNFKIWNNWKFKMDKSKYENLYNLANENTPELQSNSLTKIEVDTKDSTTPILDHFGKNTISTNLIQLNSPLKSKASSFNEFEDFLKILTEWNNAGNVKSYENFSKIKNEEYNAEAKKYKNCSNKFDPKAEYFFKISERCKTRKQELNQSSLLTENALNFSFEPTSVQIRDIEEQLPIEKRLIRENSEDSIERTRLLPEFLKRNKREKGNCFVYSIKDQRTSINDIMSPDKLESENHLQFTEERLIKDNPSDSSIEKTHLVSRLVKICAGEKENGIVYSIEDKDESSPVKDLFSSETEFLICNKSFVVQEKKYDVDQSNSISFMSNHNNAKNIKKIPKQSKSSIPVWKGKFHIKINLKEIKGRYPKNTPKF